MGLLGASQLGRAEADGGAAADQHRLTAVLAGGQHGLAQGHRVVAIHRKHPPARSPEARRHILREGQVGGSVDGDAVVVVEHHQLAQAQVARDAGGLGADPLHQATISDEAPGVVIHQLVTEAGGHQALGQGHAHGVGDALTQGAGGGLDAGGLAIFGVAGGAAAPLPKVAEIRHLQRGARQVQHAVEQHGGVAIAEHHAIPVGPVRGRGVVLEHALPERGRHVGHAHGRAGVPRVGLLDGVHGQPPDGIRGERGEGEILGRHGASRRRGRPPYNGPGAVATRRRRPRAG